MFSIVRWLAGVLIARRPSLTRAHAERTVRWAAIVLAAVLILAAIALVRRDAVADFEIEQRVERSVAALEGERRASRGDAERRAARERETRHVEQELELINAEDPDAARAPAARGSRAVAERLRND